MTAEEFVRMILSESPIQPMDEHNECAYCRAAWAEDSFAIWLERDRPGYVRDHHDSDCVWVLANQVEMADA